MHAVRTICWHTIVPSLLSRDSVVLDLGANRGRFARAVTDSFGCLCYSVEAVPELCASIQETATLIPINRAICATRQIVMINVSSEADSSSLLPIDASKITHQVAVQGCDLQSLLAEYKIERIDLMKIDIEGSEVAMFDSLSDQSLARVRQMTVEFHDFCGLVTAAEVARITQRLKKLGFYHVRFSRRYNSNVLFINKELSGVSPLLAAYIKWCVRPLLFGWWSIARRLAPR